MYFPKVYDGIVHYEKYHLYNNTAFSVRDCKRPNRPTNSQL